MYEPPTAMDDRSFTFAGSTWRGEDPVVVAWVVEAINLRLDVEANRVATRRMPRGVKGFTGPAPVLAEILDRELGL